MGFEREREKKVIQAEGSICAEMWRHERRLHVWCGWVYTGDTVEMKCGLRV